MTDGSEEKPRRSRFAGVRLGQLERTLLMAAPPLGTLAGLPIQAPEGTRSAQQGYLRAAGKLASLGLVERIRIPQATRARDPRRERPVYSFGRFWYREDPTRQHRARRVFLWVTPMGEGIRLAYRPELTSGRPIRWTDKRLKLAHRFARAHDKSPADQEAALTLLADHLDEHVPTDQSLGIEATPDEVRSPEQHSRWLLAIAYARRQRPTLGSSSLWIAARRIYESDIGDAELSQQTGAPVAPGQERSPLRFMRSDLGLVYPTTTHNEAEDEPLA